MMRYLLILSVLLISLSIAVFSAIDLYLEDQVEDVSGIVTGECRYGSAGLISNSSDPINWIEVDGDKYVWKRVNLDGIGDFDDSVLDEYEKGDPINETLMPYRPYAMYYDLPAFTVLTFTPMAAGLVMLFTTAFLVGDDHRRDERD